MSDLDNVFSEMSEISSKLYELPADAYEERATLESRREELRAKAASLADSIGDERSTAEIKTELHSLEERLEAIEGSRIDVVGQHGGSGLEISAASDAIGINQQIEAGGGADELRSRIGQLRQELDRRADG